MDVQKAIKLGDKVELVTEVTVNGTQNQYFSKVQEVKADGEVVIMAPLEAGRIIPLELNRKYGMCVYTSKGLYRCEVQVVSRNKDEKLYLINLEILTALQKYQRRQYYRLDCMLSFHYKDDEEDNWSDGTILDISGGGIRFTSTTELEHKKGVVNHIELDYGEDIHHLYLSGVIIESAKTKGNDRLYENRVEFDAISNEDREMIIRFIFEEERRRRKNKKGL